MSQTLTRTECVFFGSCIIGHLTVCLQTGGEFIREESAFLNKPPLNITYLEFSQYCYDGVWTLAYALNKTINGKHDCVCCRVVVVHTAL